MYMYVFAYTYSHASNFYTVRRLAAFTHADRLIRIHVEVVTRPCGPVSRVPKCRFSEN